MHGRENMITQLPVFWNLRDRIQLRPWGQIRFVYANSIPLWKKQICASKENNFNGEKILMIMSASE